MKKDQVYAQSLDQIPPFEFNQEVVDVFEDMITRSVPHYLENLAYQIDLIESYYQQETFIYDLGSSHGNLSLAVLKRLDEKLKMIIAVDASVAMTKDLAKRVGGLEKKIQILCAKIQDINLSEASVVILNYTLQFIAPTERESLLQNIYQALKPQGILLLSEKMTHQSPQVQELQFDFLKKFKKKNGYSDLEISQKREALDRVLIPETLETHTARLEKSGFKKIEIFLKCFSFTSMIAWK